MIKNETLFRLFLVLPRNRFQCQMNWVDVFRSRFYVAVMSFRKLSSMLFFCSSQRCAYINRYIHSKSFGAIFYTTIWIEKQRE